MEMTEIIRLFLVVLLFGGTAGVLIYLEIKDAIQGYNADKKIAYVTTNIDTHCECGFPLPSPLRCITDYPNTLYAKKYFLDTTTCVKCKKSYTRRVKMG